MTTNHSTRLTQIEAIAAAPWAFASEDITAAITGLVSEPVRRQLPTRRRNISTDSAWVGPDGTAHNFAVTIGLDDDLRPMEVFANHAKGAMAATLADACVLISLALQHGVPVESLEKSLGRVPSMQGEGPASPIGTIIAEIRRAV